MIPPAAIVALALAGAALAAWSSTAAPTPTRGSRRMDQATLEAIAAPTVLHESSGRWDAINPTVGPPGIAVGPLQWTQGSGHLGKLLTQFRAADPAFFDATIAPASSAELLAVTTAPSLAPVAGLLLSDPWWLARIRRLLTHPPYQAIMRREVTTGVHMRQALKAARAVGVLTPRGLALTFDMAVRQGEYGVPRLAASLAAGWAAAPPPYPDRLQTWAAALRSRAPAPDIDRRVAEIMNDPQLGDTPLEPVAPVA